MMDWNQIDTLLLDMDGTLLDLHFDNHFWLQHVPMRYAEARGISRGQAENELRQRYRDIEGTLQWYCVDHWSRELGLDIALLKAEVDHLIAVHPHVPEFLLAARQAGKRLVLVTNAHQRSLELKLQRTDLRGFFDRVICAHDLGLAKEDRRFWSRLQQEVPFDPAHSLFVDDSPSVLASARDYGIRWLLAVLGSDSKAPPRQRGEFPAVHDFSELLPGLMAAARQ